MGNGHTAFWAAFLGRRGVDPASPRIMDLVTRVKFALMGILGKVATRRMARERNALKRAVLGQLYGMQEETPERPGILGLYTGLCLQVT